ncbi:MAG: hypothetical protein Q9200_003849 [Gallowayella weberi]
MQIAVHDRTRMLSEKWNQQAGPHFDLTILILAAINVTAACGIIFIICYDAHAMAAFRRNSFLPYTGSRLARWRTIIEIHPAEVLPLVTAIAIALQGTVYIIVQGIGLHSLVMGCETIAQVVWPVMVVIWLTWIPSYIAPSRGICPATLIWWSTHYAKIGLAISSGLLLTFVVGAIMITDHLMRTVELDHNQRISASRVVYYLIMTTSLLVSND